MEALTASEQPAVSQGTSPKALLAIAILLAILAAGAAYLFYDRYFIRDFNTEGRAYDADTHIVYVEQAGVIWGGCAICLAVPATALAAVAVRRRTRRARSDA